jgi:hypothetical protein
MAELMFVRLREYNDNEGESWNWWLQVTGNEAALDQLAELLAASQPEDDPWYELRQDDTEPEPVVDKLVEYAETGYYASHTKVTGVFTCPSFLGIEAEQLYKGAIRSCFKAAPDA